MKITSSQVHALRKAGLSFKKIGEALSIPKGTAYRLFQRGLEEPFYFERVNIKKKGRVNPIWQYGIDPAWLYRTVPFIAMRLVPEFFEAGCDYLLDFAYSLDLSKIEKPEGYLFQALKRKALDFLKLYEIKNRKEE